MKNAGFVFLLMTVISASTFAFASADRQEVISAFGYKEMSLGTLLSPPGMGALGRANRLAKKNLKNKCKDEYRGKIVGEIKLKTISFDEGCMCAEVKATGTCKY